ncbi:hypothetical protein HHI36_012200 [Cryptolaemus montrouzieri]|uniref:Endonuclease/exonuclease/phosphatase domain-containing protein n=1 Tax=Cryptolaemus montrouzieri TaxID=559131 RepID=A0ABD2NES9_9CUCU
MDKLTDALQELSAFEKFNIILTGDFNVDFIEESDHINQLLNLIGSFGLHITTIEPSRVTQFSATSIDNVITDLSSELSVTVTEEMQFSDHRSQSFICEINEQNEEEQNLYYTRLVTDGRILSLKRRIAGFNWEDKVKNTTAQQAASGVHTAFLGMVEKCSPLKKRIAKKTEIKVKNSAALVKKSNSLIS